MEMLRDSSIGHVARFVSGARIFPYPDEQDKFKRALQKGEEAMKGNESEGSVNQIRGEIDLELATSGEKEDTKPVPPQTTTTSDGTILVGWYSTEDPENPQNWSNLKRYSVGLLLCLYTFSVYLGAAIYIPGLTSVRKEFGVGQIAGSLGMALYVLGYGMGTMIFSPLSEIPAIGRTTPYITTMIVFVILLIPTSLVQNFAGLLVLRFLLGFFGSPCLATSGASFQDIFPPNKFPYMMAIWAGVTACAPSCGPVLGGFSVPVYGWRWTQWELLWLAGPILILMLVALPETSASTILLRRARRLRQATGNMNIKSQSEIDQKHLSVKDIAFHALVKPWEINVLDPAVLFTTLYTGLIYGLVYTYFEAFPIAYVNVYHFDLGELGLTFLSILVSLLIVLPIYMIYFRVVVEQKIFKNLSEGVGSLEQFLLAGVWVSWVLPAGLFLFAWTSRSDIHWIVSLIGVGLSSFGIFFTMQSMFLYVALCYPTYAASLLAANALSRSIFAVAAILYAPPMFEAMGLGGGVSFVAGVFLLCWGGLIFLYLFGAELRAKSRFAVR